MVEDQSLEEKTPDDPVEKDDGGVSRDVANLDIRVTLEAQVDVVNEL